MMDYYTLAQQIDAAPVTVSDWEAEFLESILRRGGWRGSVAETGIQAPGTRGAVPLGPGNGGVPWADADPVSVGGLAVEGTSRDTSERTAVSLMTGRCGACHQELVLSQAQRRWKRCHPDSHVFCNTKCCNRHYQQQRRDRPGGRQAEYQRYIQQRRGDLQDVPGVIHATDQDYLGGGWSSIELPSYGDYRCSCRPKQPCAACRTWRG